MIGFLINIDVLEPLYFENEQYDFFSRDRDPPGNL